MKCGISLALVCRSLLSAAAAPRRATRGRSKCVIQRSITETNVTHQSVRSRARGLVQDPVDQGLAAASTWSNLNQSLASVPIQ
ncbi:hypothetical protein O3G_MSEX014231 [Manduca sexta]|uniref:Secreted protein n=1 Tax=Manduca sexta TaxID=7130 RepID=A0A921ZUQ6_MANSE|nr:hypothetical protein O3G_MSEX014231 [Manduca sexta]